MMRAYDSFLVLSAQDENCAGYVGIYGPKEAEKKRQKEILKAAAVNQAAGVSGAAGAGKQQRSRKYVRHRHRRGRYRICVKKEHCKGNVSGGSRCSETRPEGHGCLRAHQYGYDPGPRRGREKALKPEPCSSRSF